MDSIWIKYGFDTDLIRILYGLHMDSIWIEYGFDMGSMRFQYGFNMACG